MYTYIHTTFPYAYYNENTLYYYFEKFEMFLVSIYIYSHIYIYIIRNVRNNNNKNRRRYI